MAQSSSSTVTVIGAGPVGLFTALILAKAGIHVTVFEADKGVPDSPRAMIYFPVVLDEFKKLGLYDELQDMAYINENGVAWRKPQGEVLAKLPGIPGQPVLQLGQDHVANIILKHLREYKNADVQFNTRLVSFEQSESTVTAFLKSRNDEETLVTHVSQYLVGADGARSTVRRTLNIPFEGFTWQDFDIVAANIAYDIEGLGWGAGNFIVDPQYWAVIGKLEKGNLWRVASGEKVVPGEPAGNWDEEKGIRQLRQRLAKILPGDTSNVEVLSISPYRVHQRCASKFVDGRIILAGDAAHVTNPTGGLGLTTGFLDASFLGHELTEIIKKGLQSSVLKTYAEERRSIFLKYTNPIAIVNRKRLLSTDPEDIKERDEFFAKINAMDPILLQTLLQDELALSSTRDLIE